MTGNRKIPWLAIAYGVICGLLGAGLILLISQPPRGKAIQLLPLPSPQPLIIHVSGEVISPGVYSLPPDSRVLDAVEAAGGMTDMAAASSINLAEKLTDGQHVLIPHILPTPLSSIDSTGRSSTISLLININSATQSELESLPEIGPVTASKIIAYRETNGPFLRIEDIQKVDGIGPDTFKKIETLITVGE